MQCTIVRRTVIETGAGNSTSVGPYGSMLAGFAFAAAVVAVSIAAGSATLAISFLSFWHYYLYWLAYRYGRVPLGAFKRDAVSMKTVSLAALGLVYFSTPPEPLSLAVIALGLALNAVAARALGSDRTYYGHEVADLPHRTILDFPYGWIPHPMLLGNVAAFGGTLLNPEFRAQWWPLALAHVALNLGLLFMELNVRPLRGGPRPAAGLRRGPGRPRPFWGILKLASAGAVLASLVAKWGLGGESLPAWTGVGACAGIYAFVTFQWYQWPAVATVKWPPISAAPPGNQR